MRHYRIIVQLDDGSWAVPKNIPPGTHFQASTYLISLRDCNFLLLNDPDKFFKLQRFSETLGDWLPISSGAFRHILFDFDIDFNPSNIVNIET